MPSLLHLLFAFVLVATMGFAIQRGATCCVAAVDEIVHECRVHRLQAMLLASAWVAGGLWLAHTLGGLAMPPSGWAIAWTTFIGAALLGYGAYVNNACVFGAVARLGSGQWAYVLTMPGYFVGCWLTPRWSESAMAMRQATSGGLGPWALLVAVASVWRWWHVEHDRSMAQAAKVLLAAPHTSPGQGIASKVWSPAVATTVIGITFTGVFLLVGGRWTYTDVLADWARHRVMGDGWRALLLVALFAGAVTGGWTAGHVCWQRPTPAQAGRCLLGGLLMGVGSMLIPGGNDGLILVGLPLLWPYAWLAVSTMLASIALSMMLKRTSRRSNAPHA